MHPSKLRPLNGSEYHHHDYDNIERSVTLPPLREFHAQYLGGNKPEYSLKQEDDYEYRHDVRGRSNSSGEGLDMLADVAMTMDTKEPDPSRHHRTGSHGIFPPTMPGPSIHPLDHITRHRALSGGPSMYSQRKLPHPLETMSGHGAVNPPRSEANGYFTQPLRAPPSHQETAYLR
jgi:hypothetical protein